MVAFSQELSCLTGKGEEYYVDSEGNVLLKFIDGNIQGRLFEGNSDDTLSMP